MTAKTKEHVQMISRLRAGDMIAFDVIYRNYSKKRCLI